MDSYQKNLAVAWIKLICIIQFAKHVWKTSGIGKFESFPWDSGWSASVIGQQILFFGFHVNIYIYIYINGQLKLARMALTTCPSCSRCGYCKTSALIDLIIWICEAREYLLMKDDQITSLNSQLASYKRKATWRYMQYKHAIQCRTLIFLKHPEVDRLKEHHEDDSWLLKKKHSSIACVNDFQFSSLEYSLPFQFKIDNFFFAYNVVFHVNMHVFVFSTCLCLCCMFFMFFMSLLHWQLAISCLCSFQLQEKKLLRLKYRRKFSRVSAIALESESTSPADWDIENMKGKKNLINI